MGHQGSNMDRFIEKSGPWVPTGSVVASSNPPSSQGGTQAQAQNQPVGSGDDQSVRAEQGSTSGR